MKKPRTNSTSAHCPYWRSTIWPKTPPRFRPKATIAPSRPMHAAVTAFAKFQDRKRRASGPPKPHMPGFRRPQTRHTGASALVSRPHDGQRIAPVVLRNIVAQIHKTAGPRAVGGDVVVHRRPHRTGGRQSVSTRALSARSDAFRIDRPSRVT